MNTLLFFLVIALQFSVSICEIQAQSFEPDTGLFTQKPQITCYDSTHYFISQGDKLFYRKWGKLNKFEDIKKNLFATYFKAFAT